MTGRAWLFVILMIVSGIAPPGKAAGKGEEHPVYIDPASAGPDYSIQGEYVGKAADGKTAAQVIALGDGQFTVVVLGGGLPGDGWDGKTRSEFAARRQGETVEFSPSSGKKGSIHNGVLTLPSRDAGSIELKKVERQSPDAGAKPPAGATVLFDGSNADAWEDGKIDRRGLLVDGARTKQKYQDFKLHLEFLLPFKPFARDQDRGNSGVYIQDRYEVQILDTFGHPAEFNGCGSMYRQHAPSVNMCYPPLRWQTYDIDFRAARFDPAGKKIKKAVVTVRQNGIVVQDHYELTNKTGAGKPEGPQPGPIYLQAHHNPVFFRNVWIIVR